MIGTKTPGRASFPALGGKTRTRKPESSRSRAVRYTVPRSLNYARIKKEVLAAIAALGENDRARIPMAGTLPEQMVALALVWLRLFFSVQMNEDGGRLRMGGSVVDFLVMGAGGKKGLVIRVQGDYWHSLPDRKLTDAVQWDRLHAMGYRVADLWESDIYRAWVDGRLKQFVADGVAGAS